MRLTEEAKRFNTTPTVIFKDIQIIQDNIQVIDARECQFEAHSAYKTTIKEAWEGLTNKDLKDPMRARWADVLLKATSQLQEFLIATGAMKTAADPLKTLAKRLAENKDFEALAAVSNVFKELEAIKQLAE